MIVYLHTRIIFNLTDDILVVFVNGKFCTVSDFVFHIEHFLEVILSSFNGVKTSAARNSHRVAFNHWKSTTSWIRLRFIQGGEIPWNLLTFFLLIFYVIVLFSLKKKTCTNYIVKNYAQKRMWIKSVLMVNTLTGLWDWETEEGCLQNSSASLVWLCLKPEKIIKIILVETYQNTSLVWYYILTIHLPLYRF